MFRYTSLSSESSGFLKMKYSIARALIVLPAMLRVA